MFVLCPTILLVSNVFNFCFLFNIYVTLCIYVLVFSCSEVWLFGVFVLCLCDVCVCVGENMCVASVCVPYACLLDFCMFFIYLCICYVSILSSSCFLFGVCLPVCVCFICVLILSGSFVVWLICFGYVCVCVSV